MSRHHGITMYDLMRLQSVKRWGIIETTRPQSVAEHSFNVLWVALAVAYEYNQIVQEANSQHRGPVRPIDIAPASILGILLHDAEEVLTGDIPTPAKSVLKSFSDEHLFARIKHTLGPEVVFSRTVHDPETYDTMLMYVIKIADLIESHYFLSQYGAGSHSERVSGELNARLFDYVRELDRIHPLYPQSVWREAAIRTMSHINNRGVTNDENRIP